MPFSRWWPRIPAHGLNGLSVALGLAWVQLLIWPFAGASAAFVAASGAICASLADTPLAPDRTWYRVRTAALIGSVCSAIVLALASHPVALGLAIMGIAAVSCMALAWGPRAGPISFCGVLAVVFSLALPPGESMLQIAAHTGWTLLGGAIYVGWASFASRLLQPRLRTLALAEALESLAALLHTRSALLPPSDPGAMPALEPLQHWIEHQNTLDERLQTARDLLFPALKDAVAYRQAAALLQAIELRDTLLVAELDLESLALNGHAAARTIALREALGDTMDGIARRLARLADELVAGQVPSADTAPIAAGQRLRALLPPEAPHAPGAPTSGDAPMGEQERLVRVLVSRAEHLLNDLTRLMAALAGEPPATPLDADELQRFISPEGWPLAPLKAQFTLASPVLRHALRCGAALGCAYLIAHWLPWGAHPHWLVLSVAVVLRGTLEQTLARRDARMAGTMLGCLLVLLLAWTDAIALSSVLFLLAAGTAHAFVNRRYLITAVAATVMALLQAHLAQPVAGFGVTERLADTVLGALLAWAFSYVLPWWEHRSLRLMTDRAQRAMHALAAEVLRWPDPPRPDLALRLARREAYDSIGAVAAAARRTGVEPQAVRLPIHTLATLLVQGHVLLAQLAALRRLLLLRQNELDRRLVEPALAACAASLGQLLGNEPPPSTPAIPPAPMAAVAAPEPLLQGERAGLMRWLQRRLDLIVLAAQRMHAAAAVLQAASRRLDESRRS